MRLPSFPNTFSAADGALIRETALASESRIVLLDSYSLALQSMRRPLPLSLFRRITQICRHAYNGDYDIAKDVRRIYAAYPYSDRVCADTPI